MILQLSHASYLFALWLFLLFPLLYYSLHWLAYRDPIAALLMRKDARGVLRPTPERVYRMLFLTLTVTLPMISWLLVNTGVHSYWSYVRELAAPYDDYSAMPPDVRALSINTADGAQMIFALLLGWAYLPFYCLLCLPAYLAVKKAVSRFCRHHQSTTTIA